MHTLCPCAALRCAAARADEMIMSLAPPVPGETPGAYNGGAVPGLEVSPQLAAELATAAATAAVAAGGFLSPFPLSQTVWERGGGGR